MNKPAEMIRFPPILIFCFALAVSTSQPVFSQSMTAWDMAPDASLETHVLLVHTTLDFDGQGREVPVIEQVLIQQGRSPEQDNVWAADPDTYIISLLDQDNETLFMMNFAYLRSMTVPLLQDGEHDDTPGRVPVDIPEAVVVLPYFPDTARVRIYTKGRKIVVTMPVAQAVVQSVQQGVGPFAAPAEDGALHILIMASGYDTSGMSAFTSRAQEVQNQVLATEPFSTYADDIEMHVYSNTADLGCYTGCAGIARLLCCSSSSVISAAAASGYSYDEIIIIHNTSTYAGSGGRDGGTYQTNSYNSFAAVYDGSYSAVMAVHEFGHSFGNLCDEYSYSSEAISYTDCVNCRASCSDWDDITSACNQGCAAKPLYYRPESSIMLTLAIEDFNQVSIQNGLTPRIEYFVGGDTAVQENAYLHAAHLNDDNRTDLVYVSTSGYVYYSTNRETWTRAGSQRVQNVVSGNLGGTGSAENDLAGISLTGTVHYTTDLSSWSQIGSNRFSQIISGDFSDNGTSKDLAGINLNGYILYSTDQTTWSKIGSNKFTSTMISGDFSNSGTEKDIAAINRNQYLLYTTDNTEWTRIGTNKFTEITSAGFSDSGTQGDLAGINLNGYILYTTDLTEWARIGTNKFSSLTSFDIDGNGVNDDLAAVNLNQYLLYTTDRSAWTRIGTNRFSSVVSGDFDGDGAQDDLAGLNLNQHVLYTTDLSSWTKITKP